MLLLAIDPRSGRILARSLLPFGLMAAELIELATLGRLRIEDDAILATSSAVTATGDEDLDVALASLVAARRPPKPANWVGKPRRHVIDNYLARMSAAGIVGRSPGSRTRWQVLDVAGAATARSRLDAVASGTEPLDAAQAALGGLVHAIGLDRALYPGMANRQVRKRLRNVADQAAIDAATIAAIQAATQAVAQAAASAAASAAMVSG